MIHERDFYKLLGGFIAGEVKKQLEPVRQALGELKKEIESHGVIDSMMLVDERLTERIERLEKALGDMPVPVNGKDGRDGIDGKDGAPGKDANHDVLYAALAEHLEKRLDSRVEAYFERLPPPKDGKDGRDGVNGADGQSIQLDDVRDWLAALMRQTVADLPVPRHCVGGFIDRSGALSLSFSDGAISSLGTVVGKDGKDCDMAEVARQVGALVEAIEKPKDGKDGKDGRDGLGFKDMSVTFDGERNLIFRFVLEDRAEELSLTIPFMIYRGVWKRGGYERGDVVTRDGGSFVALADTVTEPGTKDCDWQLCCKRGADGKNGKEGPQGPPGPAGEPTNGIAAGWPLTPGNK